MGRVPAFREIARLQTVPSSSKCPSLSRVLAYDGNTSPSSLHPCDSSKGRRRGRRGTYYASQLHRITWGTGGFDRHLASYVDSPSSSWKRLDGECWGA